MHCFKGLASLIEGVVGNDMSGWVYADMNQLCQNIMEVEYYTFTTEYLWGLSESEVYENEAGDEFPVALKDKNLESWLEIPMIEDVIAHLKHYHENPSQQQIAKALRYYHKHDAFIGLDV